MKEPLVVYSASYARFPQKREETRGTLKRSLLLPLLIIATLLSACGSGAAKAPANVAGGPPLPKLRAAGTITRTVSVGLVRSTDASFSVGSTPDLSEGGPVYASESGSIVAGTLDGNSTRFYLKQSPVSPWVRLGNVPGVVTQIDFPTSLTGYALVQPAGNTATDLLYSSSDGGDNWIKVSEGNFAHIHFFDAQNAIAVSQPPLRSSAGVVIELTNNGGKTWTSQVPSVMNSFSIFGSRYVSFSFISSTTGWLAFGSQPGTGMQAKALFKTANGGQSWTEVAASSFASSGSPPGAANGLPSAGYIEQIRFLNPLDGYLVLARGGVMLTTDGGVHWNAVQLLPAGDLRSNSILALAPVTPYGGLAVTQLGAIWNQSSGSSPWSQVYPPYEPAALAYGSNQLAIATGQGRLLQNTTIATSTGGARSKPTMVGTFGPNLIGVSLFSGGEVVLSGTSVIIRKSSGTWATTPLPGGWSLLGGEFLNSSTGIVVRGPISKSIEATLNGGRNWTKIPVPFLPYSVNPVSASNWWVVGNVPGPLIANPYHKDVSVGSYNLYHTTDSGRTWTEYKGNWGQSSLIGVRFVSPSLGYLWSGSEVMVTTNGGATFICHSIPSDISIPGAQSIAVAKDGRAWLTTQSYPVYETQDMGVKWTAIR